MPTMTYVGLLLWLEEGKTRLREMRALSYAPLVNFPILYSEGDVEISPRSGSLDITMGGSNWQSPNWRG